MKEINRTIRILHLEDQPEDAGLIEWSLKKAQVDCLIKVVQSKAEYATAIGDFMPDVILSDHSLPSFNSFEAIQMLKNLGLKIPFILVTGAMSEDFAVSVLTQGADDYILKDRLHRLPVAIQEALDKFKLLKERQETERRLKESQLKALVLVNDLQNKNKELEQFTYMISHVLRAPVARILGLASILSIDSQNSGFILQKIIEETNALDNLLKDISEEIDSKVSLK